MTTLPSPNRPRPTAPLDQLPIFSSLLDHPRFGVAVLRMSDRLNEGHPRRVVTMVDVTAGLLHFFTALEAEQ